MVAVGRVLLDGDHVRLRPESGRKLHLSTGVVKNSHGGERRGYGGRIVRELVGRWLERGVEMRIARERALRWAGPNRAGAGEDAIEEDYIRNVIDRRADRSSSLTQHPKANKSREKSPEKGDILVSSETIELLSNLLALFFSLHQLLLMPVG